MNIRTRLAAAAFAGAMIAAAGATTASAASPSALPAESGRPIGVATLNLMDRSRQDPWTHNGPRRIVVSAFDPARRAVRSPRGTSRQRSPTHSRRRTRSPRPAGVWCAPMPGPALRRDRAVTRSCSSRPERSCRGHR